MKTLFLLNTKGKGVWEKFTYNNIIELDKELKKRNIIIETNLTLGDLVYIENNVRIGKNVTIENNVTIEDQVHIEDNIKIKKDSVVRKKEIKKVNEDIQYFLYTINRGIKIIFDRMSENNKVN